MACGPRKKREGGQPNFAAVVFNGKVMGSGCPELLNAIAALFAALAILSGIGLNWTQPTGSCLEKQSAATQD